MIPSSSQRVLGVLAWNTCNARCAHCGPESSIEDRTSNDHDRLLELIEEAGKIYGKDWCLSLSGGEIFLYYDKLLQYTELAHKHSGYTTLITNCFWATSVEKAIELLRPLAANDLRMLGVSADTFHAPYIPYARVRNALIAAKKLNIPAHIRSVATKSARLWEVLKNIEDGQIWFTNFMEMPLIPDGRGRELPESDLFLQDTMPTGRCPAASLTIDPSGEAMTCCNGAGKCSALKLGSVKEKSLSELEYRFASDPLIGYLRQKGPAGLREYMDEDCVQEIDGKKYVNECHLCLEIFSNEKRGDSIRTRVEEDFREKALTAFSKMLSPSATEPAGVI